MNATLRLSVVLASLLFACSASGQEQTAKPIVPPGVIVNQTGAGWYFADANGMTLYTFDGELAASQSECKGDCSKIWRPLLARPSEKNLGQWSILSREDGAVQWAYKGQAVYSYAEDPHPGATLGETVMLGGDFRFNNVGSGSVFPWHAAFEPIFTPPEVTITLTERGKVLSDWAGMTLYVLDGDIHSAGSNCMTECLKEWRPLAAPSVALPRGDWTMFTREDGKKQWAYQGQPLYTYRGERSPGELSGEIVDRWRVVVLEPGSVRPKWVTVQASDLGPVLADAVGMVLFTAPKDGSWTMDRMIKTTCKQECLDANWSPVLVGEPESPAVGNWSAVIRDDGSKQWAFEGDPIYIMRDAKPGGVLRGEHFGSGTNQQAGFRALTLSRLGR